MCVGRSVMPDSAISWIVALQTPLAMEFSRQEYWSGEPFPSPRDIPDPGIKPRLALQADSLLYAVVVAAAAKSLQSCLTLSNPTNCSLWGFSAHGILQARILEWIAIPFSRGSSQPKDRTLVSYTGGRFFTVWATGKSNNTVNQINADDLYT